MGISSSACLICEYAEHPTSDSSPLIKAWLGAQVAVAHLYENTWWWFYTQSSFTMERVPEPGWCWQVHTIGIPQASVVHDTSAVQVDAIAFQHRHHMAEVSRGGWGFKCTETWRPRFVFFVQVSITIITKTSRTGQITWIRSLETGNYSHEFIVVMSNFLLPWWQVHRYQTKMHLLKLAILVPTPSSWLFLPQQTFQWGRAEDNRRKKESGWGLVRPLEALVIPTHIPCILHAQSSGGTKNRNLTLFKYRIWGIKARLILE